MTPYERSKLLSNQRLAELRERLNGIVPPGDVVLTCGSYARREASLNSDIDFFIITQHPAPVDAEAKPPPELAWVEDAKTAIAKVVATEPADGGAFAKVEYGDAMLRNIGGERDSNQKLTRRMLFLIESEWLHNREGFLGARKRILERYIGPGMTDHQLALFLLNDLIRYYRTIAVDYEFKTFEGERPKPWGIRNIKLVFSRKLLYASGLFSIAQTSDCTRDRKIELLGELFDMPVIDRMIAICGTSNMQGVLQSYNRFLDRLENSEVRQKLIDLQKDDRGDPLFRELKNEGHHFTRQLLKLFETTFDSTHPIRRAVLF